MDHGTVYLKIATWQDIVHVSEGTYKIIARENSYYILENVYGNKLRMPVNNAGDYIIEFLD